MPLMLVDPASLAPLHLDEKVPLFLAEEVPFDNLSLDANVPSFWAGTAPTAPHLLVENVLFLAVSPAVPTAPFPGQVGPHAPYG